MWRQLFGIELSASIYPQISLVTNQFKEYRVFFEKCIIVNNERSASQQVVRYHLVRIHQGRTLITKRDVFTRILIRFERDCICSIIDGMHKFECRNIRKNRNSIII